MMTFGELKTLMRCHSILRGDKGTGFCERAIRDILKICPLPAKTGSQFLYAIEPATEIRPLPTQGRGFYEFLDVSIWGLLKTPSSRRTPGSRGGQVIENTKGLDSGLRRNDKICGFLEFSIYKSRLLASVFAAFVPKRRSHRIVSVIFSLIGNRPLLANYSGQR